MKKDQLGDEFLNSIRNELEETVAELDSETQSKLTQVRQNALSRVREPHKNNQFLYVSAALATCFLMLLIVFYPAKINKDMNTVQVDLIDDLELLSTNDDLDFLEDLDFYEWLEEYEPQV